MGTKNDHSIVHEIFKGLLCFKIMYKNFDPTEYVLAHSLITNTFQSHSDLFHILHLFETMCHAT